MGFFVLPLSVKIFGFLNFRKQNTPVCASKKQGFNGQCGVD